MIALFCALALAVAEPTPGPSPSPTVKVPTAALTRFTGPVWRRLGRSTTRLSTPGPVARDTRVETGKEGGARLQSVPGDRWTCDLAGSTEILAGERPRLIRGSVRFRVERVSALELPGARLELSRGDAVVRLEGGTLELGVLEGEARLLTGKTPLRLRAGETWRQRWRGSPGRDRPAPGLPERSGVDEIRQRAARMGLE